MEVKLQKKPKGRSSIFWAAHRSHKNYTFLLASRRRAINVPSCQDCVHNKKFSWNALIWPLQEKHFTTQAI